MQGFNLFIKIPRTRAGIPAIEETIFAGVPVNVTQLASMRWQNLAASGAWPRRLLWANTGIKDPAAPETLYIEAFAAPNTIDTMPEKTLLAFADHGNVKDAMRFDGGNAEAVLAGFTREGVNDDALAAELQRERTAAFAKSWKGLMYRIASKSEALTKAKQA